MKRCPTCNRTFTDPNLSFCIEDGTPLKPVVKDDEPTVSPPQFHDERNTDERADDWHAAAYQPPGSYVPPGGSSQRRVWPWVLGIVIVVVLGLAGLSIAVALLVPRMLRNAPRASDNPPPVAEKTNNNTNQNDNTSSANDNSNDNDAGIANANTGAPTDTDLVLAQLTNLEHEWTVANVNADKKKLGRILADDYAGPSGEGQIQGKADYLRNIQRDPSVQKWEFKNLKLILRGDRATLSGRVILSRDNVDSAFDFVDKFIWRDGRWQATGSEVTPTQETSLD